MFWFVKGRPKEKSGNAKAEMSMDSTAVWDREEEQFEAPDGTKLRRKKSRTQISAKIAIVVSAAPGVVYIVYDIYTRLTGR